MTDWDPLNLRSPGNDEPEWNAQQFLTKIWASQWRGPCGPFLDIGCGRSARHTRAVQQMGLECIAIDPSPVCLAHYRTDWHDFVSDRQFACILDIKTLCHSVNPNYQKAYDLLGPGGYLFVMCPTDDHIEAEDAYDVGWCKDYTRMATEAEMRELLKMFPHIHLYKEIKPLGPRGRLYTWVAEARK